jgi:hypothetical protein
LGGTNIIHFLIDGCWEACLDPIDFQLEGPSLLISQKDSQAVDLPGVKLLIADDSAK